MNNFNIFLRDSMTPLHQIEHNLYLGNMTAANDENILRANGISCIVQCLESRNIVTSYPFISYHYVTVNDVSTENIVRFIPQAISFIHRSLKAGCRVLVHCAAGVSRSSSVVIAYLMGKYRISFEEAKQRVKSKRQCVCPNIGFEQQLKSLKLGDLRACLN